MNPFELFMSIDEPFAAGLFELENAAPEIRYGNALKRFWETAPMPPYDGGELYPAGKCIFNFDRTIAFRPHYANTYTYNGRLLAEKSEAGNAIVLEEIRKVSGFAGWPHCVGGAGWTHSFPNYKRILAEGLDSYRERVMRMKSGDFKEGLVLTLDGIEIYRKRCMELLKSAGAPQKLIDALEKVPNLPATNMYEALVCINFIYYIDGCDDIGGLDRNLLPYDNGEDVTHLIRELFVHVDANDGWSGPLGPCYNHITLMCLRAIHGLRRPSLQLLVTEDTPSQVWEEAAKAIATGCGQPAFHNYRLYMENIKKRLPEVKEEDLERLAFGGCSETMIEGLSNVGSVDAGLNTALALHDYMKSALVKSESFDEFYKGYILYVEEIFHKTVDILNEYRRTRALFRPAMARSLLIDDCIDRELEFNKGGARYMWSLINVAGVVNVIESLNVIRTLVFDQKLYSAADFMDKLENRDEEFLHHAQKCPAYGIDNETVDALGTRFIADLDGIYEKRECFPRGKIFMVSNLFTTYVGAGKNVGATPDGRESGDPLCDSLGAIAGKDVLGPTALLSSVATLKTEHFLGTPTTNLRLSKEHVERMVAPLVKAFFEKGGMQLQVSCLSREDMIDAMENPKKHAGLIVRVGGYSEYFVRLSRELQETILKRTEH